MNAYEVVITGHGRPGSQEVVGALWITIHNVADQQAVAQLMAATGLDRGESEAIILAIELRASLVILDDRTARHYCQTQNLPVIGTVGVLLLAKDNNLISAVKQPMDALIAYGIRISPALYQIVLNSAGEQ
ncbi:MAG: DUF3368 domain-containing protein [Blastocatellia bacterium]|nr:DUF3368 domain-containing protein [Blastocatellia bacterium]